MRTAGSLLVAIVLALPGCGGSGSGNTTSPPAPVGPYPAGSAELRQFNAINAIRQANNLPALAQDSKLDQVAANHASYLASHAATTSEIQSAVESSQFTGFTGATPQDRCTQAGFNGVCSSASAWSEGAITGCAASPYYGLAILDEAATSIGIKVPGAAYPTVEAAGPHLQLGAPIPQAPGSPTWDWNFISVSAIHRAIHLRLDPDVGLLVHEITVRDSSGNPISGTLLTNAESRTDASQTVDPAGRVPRHAAVYVLDSVPPDRTYTVHLSYSLHIINEVPWVWGPIPLDRTVVGSCPS